MLPKTLTFFAIGEGLVPNFDLQRARVRAFVGRKWVELPADTEPKRHTWMNMDKRGVQQDPTPSRWHWAPTGEPETVKFSHDYVKAAKKGHLWPADEATAKACGVKLEPLPEKYKAAPLPPKKKAEASKVAKKSPASTPSESVRTASPARITSTTTRPATPATIVAAVATSAATPIEASAPATTPEKT